MRYYGFTKEIMETYPELIGREFTWPQMKEIYRDLVDKAKYPDFSNWMMDMRKADVVRQIYKYPVITKDIQEEFEHYCEWNRIPVNNDIPWICGDRGRVCRQMGKEEGANRMLCNGCPLARFAEGR